MSNGYMCPTCGGWRSFIDEGTCTCKFWGPDQKVEMATIELGANCDECDHAYKIHAGRRTLCWFGFKKCPGPGTYKLVKINKEDNNE